MQRICRSVGRRLALGHHLAPASLASRPELAGYVCGVVFAMAERWSHSLSYQRRLVQRGYVEIFGDPCEALDFLTLTPELQRRDEFMEAFRQAGSDLDSTDYAVAVDRRLAALLGLADESN